MLCKIKEKQIVYVQCAVSVLYNNILLRVEYRLVNKLKFKL